MEGYWAGLACRLMPGTEQQGQLTSPLWNLVLPIILGRAAECCRLGFTQCTWAQAQPLFPQLLTKALALVRGCNCRSTSGCPACIQSMSCDEYNAVLHKEAAIAILEITLAAEAEYAERLQKQVLSRLPCGRCSCDQLLSLRGCIVVSVL